MLDTTTAALLNTSILTDSPVARPDSVINAATCSSDNQTSAVRSAAEEYWK